MQSSVAPRRQVRQGLLCVLFVPVWLFSSCKTESGPLVLDLKLGHVGPPGSLFEASCREFANRVNARLEGQARVTVFGSSQLGADMTMLQKLKLGTVDLSLPSTIFSSIIDEFGLFEMPYLVRDREHMGLIEAEIFWKSLAPLAEREGYKILAIWENGFRHITNNSRPIQSPQDLSGIKLRTPRGQWRIRMFQAYGANPTPMPFSEVFMALQTGVMDGQENPFTQIYNARLHEVQRFLSLTGHVYTPAYLTASLRHWAELDEDVRAVLQDTARQMQGFVYRQARRMDEQLLKALRGSGIEINRPDLERFRQASRPVYEQFGQEVDQGRQLIEEALALVR